MSDRAIGESSMNFKTMCAVKKEKKKTSHVFKGSLQKKKSIFFGNFLKGLMFLGFSSKKIYRNKSENEHIPCNT